MEKFGIFETVRVEKGKAVFLEYHYERLLKSASDLDISFNFTFNEFKEKIESAASFDISLVKFTLFEDGTFSVTSRECLSKSKVRLKIFYDVVRKKDKLSVYKTLSIYDSLYALREVRKSGFDEAVILDVNGFVSETAFANIFWVKDGIVFTPSLETGCLPGTRRKLIFEILETLGVSVIEGFYRVDSLLNADEIFITSARYDVVFVEMVDEIEFKVHGKSWTQRIRDVIKRIRRGE